MERLLWVCLAGAMGTGARYLVAVWAGSRFGTVFPYGTLIVNVAGCFLIGLLMQLALNLPGFPVNLRFALTTGFLGGLTTYSSFAYETTKLAEDGAHGTAALNLAVTTVGGLGAVVLGLALARWLTRAA